MENNDTTVPEEASIDTLQTRVTQLEEEIVRLKINEEALKNEEAGYREIVQNANSIIMILDPAGNFIFINEFAQKYFGFTEPEIIGKNLIGTILAEKDSDGKDNRHLLKKIIADTEKHTSNENENIRKDGSRVWVSWTNKSVLDETGAVKEILCIGNDITKLIKTEEKLERITNELRSMSLEDELTGLLNRRGFMTIAGQQIKIANRSKRNLLVMYIDLDYMKWINDSFGHAEGDRALKGIADVIRNFFRDSDVVARIGGDEFVILAIDFLVGDPNVLITRFTNAMKMYNEMEKFHYELSASYGAILYDPANPCSLEDLMSRADAKMYAAKRKKKGLPPIDENPPEKTD